MGVWHSPRSPGKWYDSPDVLLAWIGYLLETNREDAKDTKEEEDLKEVLVTIYIRSEFCVAKLAPAMLCLLEFSSPTATIMMISPKFLNPFLTILPLENGDRLSRAEFERRYNAMTAVKKLN